MIYLLAHHEATLAQIVLVVSTVVLGNAGFFLRCLWWDRDHDHDDHDHDGGHQH